MVLSDVSEDRKHFKCHNWYNITSIMKYKPKPRLRMRILQHYRRYEYVFGGAVLSSGMHRVIFSNSIIFEINFQNIPSALSKIFDWLEVFEKMRIMKHRSFHWDVSSFPNFLYLSLRWNNRFYETLKSEVALARLTWHDAGLVARFTNHYFIIKY